MRAEQALTAMLGGAPLSELRLVTVDTQLMAALSAGGAAQLRAVREALAAVFDLAGHDEAARRCRSPRWARAESQVERDPAATAAVLYDLTDDPLLPPSLLDFQFGDHPGPIEARAQLDVVDALEDALAAGETDPSSPDWREAARTVARRVLERPHGDHPTLRQAVEAERLAAWRQSRSDARQRLVDEVGPLLAEPSAWQPEHAQLPERVGWLFELLGDGVPVRDDRLDPQVARALSERAGWKTPRRPPRSPFATPAEALRVIVRTAGLLAYDVERDAPTALGRRLVADPPALWRHVCRWGVVFQRGTLEVLLLLLLTREEWREGELVAAAGPVVTEEEYLLVDHPTRGVAPARGSVRDELLYAHLEDVVGITTALGAVEVAGSRAFGRRLRVPTAGAATLRAVLRGHATGSGRVFAPLR